ncbi:MAG: tRNA pseudouridine synthase A [Phycisphaerales bacterium]
MPRYKLTIAYDGTDFCGWQKQEPPESAGVAAAKLLDPPGLPGPAPADEREPGRTALRTVQAVVERAIREAVREPVILHGASRTDAGVHARGQVAAFTCSGEATDAPRPDEPAARAEGGAERRPATGWPLSRGTDALLRAINSRLPEDVLVLDAEAVSDAFNPISDCTAKGYSYTLHLSPHRALWDRRFVHHIWVPLDAATMNAAAAHFVGEHDFAAFAAAGHGRQSTVRTVYACRVTELPVSRGVAAPVTSAPGHPAPGGDAPAHAEGGSHAEPGRSRRLVIEVSGNGFLWNMVRIIAGTLVEAGRGKLTPADIPSAIESKDRRRAGPTLPPHGLCLEWVRY